MIWRFGQEHWAFPGLRVMAILNVTPDSFYDGGRLRTPEQALERAREMVEQGAELIDVGGESTRPQAREVPLQEELDRVLPVIRLLSSELSAPISIDTTKSEVARRAIEAGARVVNDVSGGRSDPVLLRVVAESGAGLVLMHSRGNPRTMQQLTGYQTLEREILSELGESVEAAISAGVHVDQLVVDPGFGFAKTAGQNVELLRQLPVFRALGRPILVGVSRKSFLGAIVGKEAPGRLAASVAAQILAALRGGDILRTHDVAEAMDSLRVLNAILASDSPVVR